MTGSAHPGTRPKWLRTPLKSPQRRLDGGEPTLGSQWRRAERGEGISLLGRMLMLVKMLFTGGAVKLIFILVLPSINRHLCRSTSRSK